MSVVGIDIGDSHIKAVSVDKSGRNFKLNKYVISPSNNLASSIFDEKNTDIDTPAKALKEFFYNSDFRENHVVAVLPESAVFSKIIPMPKLPEKDLKTAIEWAAEEHIPRPVAEVYIKHVELKTSSQDSGGILGLTNDANAANGSTEYLITAVPKVIINKYLSILDKAELEVVGMEPVSLSTIRGLVSAHNLNFSSVILTIGYSNVDLYLVIENSLRFVRSINFGISSMLKAISQELDISYVQANEYLYTYGLKKDALNGKIANTVLPVLEMIQSEFRKSQNYIESRNIYRNPDGTSKIKQIVISGGGALIPEILVYFATQNNLEIQFANPWVTVDITSIISHNDLVRLGPLLAPSVGAALKGF